MVWVMSLRLNYRKQVLQQVLLNRVSWESPNPDEPEPNKRKVREA